MLRKNADFPGWQPRELASTLQELKIELPDYARRLKEEVVGPVVDLNQEDHTKEGEEKPFTVEFEYFDDCRDEDGVEDEIKLIHHPPLSLLEISDGQYILAMKSLHYLVDRFVRIHLCPPLPADFDFQTQNPWDVTHTPEFIAHVSRVAVADPACGSWDRILIDPDQRYAVMMGVFFRIFELEIWDRLLFGCEEYEEEMLVSMEKTLIEKDGELDFCIVPFVLPIVAWREE